MTGFIRKQFVSNFQLNIFEQQFSTKKIVYKNVNTTRDSVTCMNIWIGEIKTI